MSDGSISTVTTDDEPDKVFIHVLSTIGIREESLDFVLQDQSISIIHHLCLLEDCDIKSWATDGPLNTLEVRMIIALKRFVNNCKAKNGGTLPPNWHEGGLILEKLSGRGAPTSHNNRREISILVWVKIKCPTLQSSMLKEYHQFSACSKFTYGQLLDKYLDKAVNLGLLLENNKAPLMQHKINVFLYTSLEETRKRLCATVDDSCEPIVGSESKYIQFVFESFEQRRVPQTDAFCKMMSSQRDLVVPTRVPGTTFPSSLFNFLVEGYVEADLGVSRTDLPVLEFLTRATRDVLQNIGKFWRSKFPLQFQHQLERHNTRDRTTNTKAMIERRSTVLNKEMRKASSFLATN
jgi:hypothetical protein